MKYLFLILSVILFDSCSEFEDYSPLDGYYSLVSVSCECDDFQILSFQQQWKFDFAENELDVVVFDDVKDWLILEEGKYPFEIMDTITSIGSSTEILSVADRYFWFEQKDNSIWMSDPGASHDAGAYYVFGLND